MASSLSLDCSREDADSCEADAAHGCIVASTFEPHPLLRNPHLQTLAASVFRPTPKLDIRSERITTPDGDFIDIGWCGESCDDSNQQPIAVLIHGLTGGFDSKYLRGLAVLLTAAGWRVALLVLRGAGAEPNLRAKTYHHGDTGDFRYFCRLLQRRAPQAFLAAAGWSLGANILLKALGEEGARSPLNAAVAASPPFQIQECAERLRSGLSRGYQRSLLQDVKTSVLRKHETVPVPSGVDIEAAMQAQDFLEFDAAYTAPLAGYRDREDYYQRASCGQFLSSISRPTLIVHAVDDPFMDPSIVPDSALLSPSVTLELSDTGGHVGFMARGPYGLPHAWLEQRMAAHLQSEFEAQCSALCRQQPPPSNPCSRIDLKSPAILQPISGTARAALSTALR